MIFHLSIDKAKKALQQSTDKPFIRLMQNGSMSVEYYAPKKVDHQTPHSQDELYMIASGQGSFVRNGETVFINQGDVLFVPAGMEHRFENFSDDFATWVIFYGPPGGED